jgi:hypothetical protein
VDGPHGRRQLRVLQRQQVARAGRARAGARPRQVQQQRAAQRRPRGAKAPREPLQRDLARGQLLAAGVGGVATAALATGITFVVASVFGRRMSDSVAQSLTAVVGLGIIGLLIAMVVQVVGGIFAPQMFLGGGLELLIAGFGTVLFVGAAFVDFYTMPRTYNDDQYLAGALGMYLTYINLFIFILRLIIALNGGSRRD